MARTPTARASGYVTVNPGAAIYAPRSVVGTPAPSPWPIGGTPTPTPTPTPGTLDFSDPANSGLI